MIGAHVSRTADTRALGLDCAQVYLGNPRSYAPARPGPVPEVPFWVHAPLVAHVASEDPETRVRSRDCLRSWLDVSADLGGRGLVVHPGGSRPSSAVSHWAEFLETLGWHDCPLLLENSASLAQVASSPEGLAALVRVGQLVGANVGACVDSCHAWAAGQISTAFVTEVGHADVALVHANGSRDPLRSGRDRHADFGSPENQLSVDNVAILVDYAGAPAVCECQGFQSVAVLRKRIPWDDSPH